MIRVTVDLFRPLFHGLGETGRVDWPPSPVRLLGALKSGTHALDESETATLAHAALAVIARADPPLIHTPTHRDLELPDTYTERTWVPDRLSTEHEERADRALSLEFFDMDSKSRERKPQNAVALTGTVVAYDIAAELSDRELDALHKAAARVPYFGRSNDPASVMIGRLDKSSSAAPTTAPLGTDVAWHPRSHSRGTTRGWTADTIAWMDENYERVFSADPDRHRLPPLPADAYTHPLQYSTVKRSLDERRNELEILPLQYSLPHHRIQWAFRTLYAALPVGQRLLPITVSNHTHADGRLVGVGLYPEEHPPSESAASTVAAIPPSLDPFLDSLDEVETRGRTPDSRLVHQHSKTLEPRTWSGPSRRWRSSTPLRGFPDLRVVKVDLQQQLKALYGAEPEILEAAVEPVSPWHRRWRNSGYTDGLTQWWLTLHFEEEVPGPLVLGESQDHGFGVFIPVPEEQAR